MYISKSFMHLQPKEKSTKTFSADFCMGLWSRSPWSVQAVLTRWRCLAFLSVWKVSSCTHQLLSVHATGN